MDNSQARTSRECLDSHASMRMKKEAPGHTNHALHSPQLAGSLAILPILDLRP